MNATYEALHDRLSDMIEGGRLTERDIPDDYQWLVRMLEKLANQAAIARWIPEQTALDLD